MPGLSIKWKREAYLEADYIEKRNTKDLEKQKEKQTYGQTDRQKDRLKDIQIDKQKNRDRVAEVKDSPTVRQTGRARETDEHQRTNHTKKKPHKLR